MIVSLWQCPDPQFKIASILQELIRETGLESRSISPEGIITEGHPFFAPSARDKTDSVFPKIGVEWELDDPADDLGQNTSELLVNGPLKDRISLALRASKYEHLDFDRFSEFLQSGVKYADTSSKHIESTVTLSGWATGNAAEKTHIFLYQALDACIPYLFKQLARETGASLTVPRENVVLNIRNNQIADNAFGFEYKVNLRQVRETYRLLNDKKIPVYADIFYNYGRSRIDLKQ